MPSVSRQRYGFMCIPAFARDARGIPENRLSFTRVNSHLVFSSSRPFYHSTTRGAKPVENRTVFSITFDVRRDTRRHSIRNIITSCSSGSSGAATRLRAENWRNKMNLFLTVNPLLMIFSLDDFETRPV